MSRNSGFTLVELLVALAIFAILAGFAYRGLNAMLESREALQKETRKWRDVTVFVGRIERDLKAVLDRPSTGASGVTLAPVSSSMEIAAVPSGGLALTRAGNALQENALAAPQRVGYRFRDGRIERLAWTSIDAAPREEPFAVDVLLGVRALEFRFLAENQWRPGWGAPGANERLPAAVEMALTLASGERIVRVVDLPRRP